jgi:hypothetical protein
MYAKLKYIILTLLLIGFGLSIFNYTKLSEYESISKFYLPAILFSFLIVFFFLPRRWKMKSIKLTLTSLGVGILFSLVSAFSTYDYFDNERRNKIFAQYSALNCEEMNERFAKDLENDELKHFSGGFAGTGNLGKNLKKYNIEHFDLGCIIQGNLMCYSELVWDYLKEKENVEIDELYE